MLYVMLMWIVVFAALPLIFGDREIRFGTIKIKLVIGGFLLYLGKEVKTRKAVTTKKSVKLVVLFSMFIGIVLFYIFFVPLLINMVKGFFMFLTGVSHAPPQPVAVPVPILFTFTSIIKYLIVSIAIGATLHELAHAVTALREGVNVRNWGIGVAFLIPLAFVELDDDLFKNAKPLSRALIASSGPLANALIALAAIAIATLIPYMGFSLSQAIVVANVDCSICSNVECPAARIGLREGDIIYAINGVVIRSGNDIANILKNLSIGSNVTFTICRNGLCKNITTIIDSYNKKLGNNIPCIGVSMENTVIVLRNGIPYNNPMIIEVINYINFIFAVNLSLYIFNAIPLFVTDGTVFLSSIIPSSAKLRFIIDKKLLDIVNVVLIAVAAGISTYVLLSG